MVSAVTAAAANADLARELEHRRPAALRTPPGFREAAPNRRTVAFDHAGLRGTGPVLYLADDAAALPPGVDLVHAGIGFVLGQAADSTAAAPPEEK